MISEKAGFAQLVSPGQLSKAHEKLSGFKNCTQCHALGKGISDGACTACHKKLVERIRNGEGLHARTGSCIACHTEHKGRNSGITHLDKETFNHTITGFEMRGGHKVLSCTQCHKAGTYGGLSRDCLSCHADVHDKTASADCLQCHAFRDWNTVRFDHSAPVRFTLKGKHADAKCDLCHQRYSFTVTSGTTQHVYNVPRFRPLPFEKCSDCHREVHRKTLKAGACKNCHTPDGWTETAFNHNDPAFSDFQLSGRHEGVSCKLCHPTEEIVFQENGQTVTRMISQFKATKHDSCYECHYDVHRGEFKGRNCDSCHSLKEGWEKYTFRHESSRYAGFKLKGRHKDVDCHQCHRRREITYVEFNKEKRKSTGTFRIAASGRCDGCHFDVHQGQFSDRNCDACHSLNTGWKETFFRHEAEAYKGFKLRGKHKGIECEKCHTRKEINYVEFREDKKAAVGRFKLLTTGGCGDCHREEHKGPFKEIGNMKGVTCEDCHSVDRKWNERRYKHKSNNYKKYTRYGGVEESKCEQCHICDTDTFCISCCIVNMSNFGLPMGSQ